MFSLSFFFFAILHILIRELNPGSGFDFVTKPIPIFLLLFWVFFQKKDWKHWNSFSGKIFLGLVLGVTGDILLMFPSFFLPGLVSFLIGHVFYIFAFYPEAKLKFLYSIPLWILGISMAYYLQDKTGDMLIPVLFYLVVILTMSWMALCRNPSSPSYKSLVLGSLLFVFSDTCLALIKFTGLETGHNSAWVMSSYYLAQYFIGHRSVKLDLESS
jgi:uncharacterized membrane protein YhhN